MQSCSRCRFDPLTVSKSGHGVKLRPLVFLAHLCTECRSPPLFSGTAAENVPFHSLSWQSHHRFSLSLRLAPGGCAGRLKCKCQNLTLADTLILCQVIRRAACREGNTIPRLCVRGRMMQCVALYYNTTQETDALQYIIQNVV